MKSRTFALTCVLMMLVAVTSFATDGDLEVLASIDGKDVSEPPGPSFSAGSSVKLSIEVTNSSDLKVEIVKMVVDPADVEFVCGRTMDQQQAILGPGESFTCDAALDVAKGKHEVVTTFVTSVPGDDGDPKVRESTFKSIGTAYFVGE